MYLTQCFRFQREKREILDTIVQIVRIQRDQASPEIPISGNLAQRAPNNLPPGLRQGGGWGRTVS